MMNDNDRRYQISIDCIELAADLVAVGEIQLAAEMMQMAATLLFNMTNNATLCAIDQNSGVAK